jgi:2',3'-cyclic-nucleotide 2'-phosphodiesterase/3'-nucleotidase
MPLPQSDSACLTVMATTDLHAQLWPHAYDTDRPTTGRGLARLATVIRAERAAAANSLLLDNGDLFQGSQLADTALICDERHPMLAAMALLGYDAATLGNHDFNYGLDRLSTWMAQCPHPVTLSNLVVRRGGTVREDLPLLPPFLILDRDLVCASGACRRLRIGVIGAAPPQTLLWDQSLLDGRLQARGIHDAVAAWLPDIRAAGADLVIALCHSGIGDPTPDPDAEHAALSVAALDGVDLVVAGHTHDRFPGEIGDAPPGADPVAGRLAGTPAVLPGALGSDLGVMELDLRITDGRWRIDAARCRLRSVDDTAPDPEVLAATRSAHVHTRRAARRPYGRLAAPVSGLFPLVCHSPTLQLASDAQVWAAQALLRGTAAAALPLLSAIAPFKAGGDGRARTFTDIPAGPLRRGHLVELAPFPNSLCIIEATGAQLRLWLERGVSGFATIAPGQTAAPPYRPGAACYNFEQIYGLRYRIDLSRQGWFDGIGADLPQTPDTARIVTLRTATGQQVRPQDRFAVATNTYRAAGGGGYGFLSGCRRLATAEVPLLDTLAAYVAACPQQPGALRAVWGFAPVAATALVPSAPWADAGRHGDGWRHLTAAPDRADGAKQFLLDLSQSDLPPP